MVAPVHQKLTVVDCCVRSAGAGVRVGMSLAEARALCGQVRAVDHDPAGDDRAREALGRWLTRFTPTVAMAWPTVEIKGAGKLKLPPAPPLLLLDITGCERLFGGLGPLVRRVMSALNGFGIPATMAVAPTPGAAWAGAYALGLQNPDEPSPRGRQAGTHDSHGRSADGSRRRFCLIEAGRLVEGVSPLPVDALRLATDTLDALHHLGLHTIGQVLRMPRESLPSRLGALLPVRIAQLLGERAEPLTALAYDPPVQAEARFDEPVDSLETLWLVLQKLTERIVPQLDRRGRGARQIEFVCRPDRYSPRPDPVSRVIHLSRPSRHARRLFELLRCATEQLDCGNGFVMVRLRVLVHEPMVERQACLLGDEIHQHAAAFDRLIERLRIRLGDDAVVRPVLTQSRLPERAWRGARAGDPANTGDAARQGGIPIAAPAIPRLRVRPMCLLPSPIEIAVVVEPCDYWDGNPAQFTFRQTVHRLVCVSGPERIAGEWWHNHHKTRDYYDVTDDRGRRYWIFRVIRLLDGRHDGQTHDRHAGDEQQATGSTANAPAGTQPVKIAPVEIAPIEISPVERAPVKNEPVDAGRLSVRWFLHGLFH